MNLFGKSADYSGKSIGWQAAWSNFASLIAGLKQAIQLLGSSVSLSVKCKLHYLPHGIVINIK